MLHLAQGSHVIVNTRHTSPPRFMAGLLVLAVTAAGLDSIPFGTLAVFALPVSFVLWLFCATALGTPIWWVLTRVRPASLRGAICLGFLLPAVAAFGYAAFVMIQARRSMAPSLAGIIDLGPKSILLPALIIGVGLGLCGAVGALAGWNVAYRPGASLRKPAIDEVFG